MPALSNTRGWFEKIGKRRGNRYNHQEGKMGKLFARHSGEYLSMGFAVILTCSAVYFFWFVPNWNPTSDWPKYLLAWLVIGYKRSSGLVMARDLRVRAAPT